ncbi:hypothetical protein RhiirC2_799730 [Rhizophagus irregularis]|uniref:Uncharacterized protein n=1 Tax=Rhizophagus irregularis TaxID=588596 RepID=A0A2N1M4J4_9GLOM|nr:hypothetical protein RhiirC2_799730 [Rhizophagus irregularis]
MPCLPQRGLMTMSLGYRKLKITISGDTFNRIVMESHDYIDGRLIHRQTTLPLPPPQEQPREIANGIMDEYNDLILEQNITNRTPSSGPSGLPHTLEDHALRLAEFNIELCKECLMPANHKDSQTDYKKISDESEPLQVLELARDKLVQIICQEVMQIYAIIYTKTGYGDPYEDTRKWLFEIALYQFLQDTYPDGIDEPFTTFYENYEAQMSNPMTKNFASRALEAIGLKAKMLMIDFEGCKKSTMIFRASAEELCEILTKYY